jgi:hypothetical protein
MMSSTARRRHPERQLTVCPPFPPRQVTKKKVVKKIIVKKVKKKDLQAGASPKAGSPEAATPEAAQGEDPDAQGIVDSRNDTHSNDLVWHTERPEICPRHDPQ